MSHVTLVVPPAKYTAGLGYERYLHTPLESITCLRSVLLAAGHSVQINDYRACSPSAALSRILSDISTQADIIGFTSFFDSFSFIERAIAVLKHAGLKALTVVGGQTPSALPDVFLQVANADVIALGEGEHCIVALAGAPRLDSLKCVPGIAWKSEDGQSHVNEPSVFVALDALPACDWSYVDPSQHITPMYSAGRGCSGQCTFCARKLAPKRFRSPAAFRKDLCCIREVTSEKWLLLNDSDFIHENPYLNEYCSILKDMSWKWSCLSSPFNLEKDLLEHLYDAGCRNLRVGIEAHDEEMIRRHRIGFDLQEVDHVLDVLEAGPIPHITGYYVLGLPDQTQGSLDAIIREAGRRRRIVPRAFHLLPLPGAAVFETLLERQLIKDIPTYLRSLESISIDGVSEDIPNASACSYAMLDQTHQELAALACERIQHLGSIAFP